jgi:hypothetical protein
VEEKTRDRDAELRDIIKRVNKNQDAKKEEKEEKQEKEEKYNI